MSKPKKVIVIPCSGIGKSFGTVSRMAAYQVIEDDRPEKTQLVPLSLLVLGDEGALAALVENPVITIDGCKLACATKMVKESGGDVIKDFAVLEVFRRYRDFKPEGIAELNEGGQKLTDALAKEVDRVVDELTADGGKNA
jgi:uncharacterized metal-binding protein